MNRTQREFVKEAIEDALTEIEFSEDISQRVVDKLEEALEILEDE